MAESCRFTVVNIGTLSMNKFWHETERVRSAAATCTLLEMREWRVLVDPSPGPEDLEPILFARTGLSPADIDMVFLTHFHGDHRYGIALFAGKPWLMAPDGLAEWKAQSSQDADVIRLIRPAERYLPEGITLFPSPGHTKGHHSLIVSTEWGPLVVAGDAVMARDFFDAEEGYHNSVDLAQAAHTIRHIRDSAALLIPGHDNLILNL